MKLIILSALFLLGCSQVKSAKILAVAHTSSKSHFILQLPLYKKLAELGHEITVISPYPQKTPIANYTDIELTECKHVFERVVKELQQNNYGLIGNMYVMYGFGVELNKVLISEPGVKQLIASNATFDLVILESFLAESLLGLGHHYNAPIVSVSTFGATKWVNDYVGNPNPLSYLPHFSTTFTNQMTFWQRVTNVFLAYFDVIMSEYSYHPQIELIYNKEFPDPKPTYSDLRKNAVHLALINMHFSLATARPYVSNMIEVGGMHVSREENPLPDDLQAFIDSAQNGVIYFSLGSNVKPSALTVTQRNAMVQALLKRKEHIIWKFDGELPELAGRNNFFVSSWLPQDDILRNPKVVLFITHGGLLSTTETIYHGTPIVGIPVFGDQALNMMKAIQGGYALMCQFHGLTEECLSNAVEEVISNEKYTKTVKALSERFRDRPMHPLDTAVYWIEYVIRHKGSNHMRSEAMNLNFIQLHSIDTIGFIAFVLLMILFLIRFIVKKLCKLFVGLTKKGVSKKKNN